MKYLKRDIEKLLLKKLKPNKVTLLLGPRRTGKTMLLKQFMDNLKEPFIFLNGEDYEVHDLLKRRSVQNYKNIIGNNKLLIIDEAQKIPDIGNVLKLMVDSIPKLKVIVTGSSAFDIMNIAGEPLTGRKFTLKLFPFSENEFSQLEDVVQKPDNLKFRLVYGNYPELIHIKNFDEKKEYLKEIVNSYLLKDILSLDGIRSSSKIFNLLRMIAYQVGSLVSYNEIGMQIGMSSITVEKYLDLLSKVFILHKVEGYSRNLRKEINKNAKWYFLDNGIRNTLISNLNTIELRNDISVLWENYIISERLKYQGQNNMLVNNYFWRTYDKQEIDWVEERSGRLYAYEFKWSKNKTRIPAAWKKAYPDSQFKVITKDNYLNWIL